MTNDLSSRQRLMAARAPIFFAMNMLAVGGIVIGSNVGTALLLKAYGAEILPWLFFAIAILTIVVEKITNLFRRTVSPELMLLGIAVGLNILIAGTWFLANQNFAPATILLYVLPELAAFLVLTQVWNIAARYFDASESKHRFPMIAAGGSLGGMLAGIAVSLFVGHIAPLNLLWGWCALLFTLIPMAEYMKRSGTEAYPWSPTRGERAQEEAGFFRRLQWQFASIWNKRFYRGLLLTVALGTVLTFTLDYQSSKIFNDTFDTPEGLTSFLGLFTSVAFFLGLIIQAFLITPIVTRLGLASTALIFPFATLISSGVMFFSSALWAGVVGSFTRRYLKGSFFTVTNDLLLNALHPQERPRVRSLLKGTVTSSAAIMASGIIISAQSFGTPITIAIIGIVAAAIYVGFSFDLRKCYVTYLLQQMAKGRTSTALGGDEQRHGNIVTATYDPQHVFTTLDTVNDDVALLMLDPDHFRLPKEVLERLPEIYAGKSQAVKKAIIHCLAAQTDFDAAGFFNIVLVDNNEELVTELFRRVLQSGRIPIGEQAIIRSNNRADSTSLRAAALALLCHSRETHLAYVGYSRLNNYISSHDRCDLLVALETVLLLRSRLLAWEFLPRIECDDPDPEYLLRWLCLMEELEDGADGSFGECYLKLFLTQPQPVKRRALQLIGRIPPNRIFASLWEHMSDLSGHEQRIILRLGRKVDLIQPAELAIRLMSSTCLPLVFREGAKTWMSIYDPDRDSVTQNTISLGIRKTLDRRVRDLRTAMEVTHPGSLLIQVLSEETKAAAENLMAWSIEQCPHIQNVDALFSALVSIEKDATDKAVETIENIAGMNLVSEIQSLVGLLNELRTGVTRSFAAGVTRREERREERHDFLVRLAMESNSWIAAVAMHELALRPTPGIMSLDELKKKIPAGHFEDKYFVEAVIILETAA